MGDLCGNIQSTSVGFPGRWCFTVSGFMSSFTAFAAVFATTQVPLAIMEVLSLLLIMKYVVQVKGDVLVNLQVLTSVA